MCIWGIFIHAKFPYMHCNVWRDEIYAIHVHNVHVHVHIPCVHTFSQHSLTRLQRMMHKGDIHEESWTAIDNVVSIKIDNAVSIEYYLIVEDIATKGFKIVHSRCHRDTINLCTGILRIIQIFLIKFR